METVKLLQLSHWEKQKHLQIKWCNLRWSHGIQILLDIIYRRFFSTVLAAGLREDSAPSVCWPSKLNIKVDSWTTHFSESSLHSPQKMNPLTLLIMTCRATGRLTFLLIKWNFLDHQCLRCVLGAPLSLWWLSAGVREEPFTITVYIRSSVIMSCCSSSSSTDSELSFAWE